MAFAGRPGETVTFLRGLRANNTRDWFEALPQVTMTDLVELATQDFTGPWLKS